MNSMLFDKINDGFENAGKGLRKIISKITTKSGMWTIGIIFVLLFGIASFLRGCFKKD